jgi:putative YpdA family bacillithiol system oxidoreductase
MESLLIWIIAGALTLIIFVPYFLKFRKQQKADYERKLEATALGADKAIAQFPQIDQERCIGCAACVAACPEGDVLGIVFGKATVINGLKCVGHGRCAEACPVQGITVGLGDISKRDDIPFIDEHNQTNIPGLYIAGELGGLALIKNAISQGQKVVDHIAGSLTPSSEQGMYDIVIVGAGPAGISAALSAKKHNLSCLLLDQQGFGGTILQYPRKKLVMTRPIEIPLYGWLNNPEYEKEELLAIWQEIDEKFSLNVKIGEKLENVSRTNGTLTVHTQNDTYKAQRVVLALGRRGTPRKLGVPGEDQKKVMYKLIDAESYTNTHLLVVGGGDSAVEAAIGLAHQSGNTVTLSYRKNKLFRIKQKNEERFNEMLAAGKLQVDFNSNVLDIRDSSVLLQSEEKGEFELKNDFVFIFAGGEPPFDLLKKMGIRFGEEAA